VREKYLKSRTLKMGIVEEAQQLVMKGRKGLSVA